MGSVSWQPTWWKEATREQTKSDLHLGGHELNQDADDTVKQAMGKEVIPDVTAPNTLTGNLDWDDAEQPLMYGFGARQDANLESSLRRDWESAGGSVKRRWDDVKRVVRHGYDRVRP